MVLEARVLSWNKNILFSVCHGFEIIFFGRSIENTDLWTIFVEKRSE